MRMAICLMVLGFLGTAWCSYSAEKDRFINSEEILLELQKDRDDSQLEERVTAERTVLVRRLIAIVGDAKKSKSMRIHAIGLLGNLRASEAVDVLMANIGLPPDFIDENTYEIVCPCGAALIAIGSPVRTVLIDRLKHEEIASNRVRLTHVLIAIEGDRVAEWLITDVRTAAAPIERENLDHVSLLLKEFFLVPKK